MENTYTYTARSATNPEKVVTLTLRGDRMSVGSGVPVEQAARLIESATAEEIEEGEAQPESERETQLWLKPMGISLAERGTSPLRVIDVDARATGAGYLWVRGWVRVGGLRLAPVTLLDGTVDNPDAALAFVEELARRKDKYARGPALLSFLDYWATWLVLGSALMVFFGQWRKRHDEAEA